MSNIFSFLKKIDYLLFFIYGIMGFGSLFFIQAFRDFMTLNANLEFLICFLILSPIYYLVRVLKKNTSMIRLILGIGIVLVTSMFVTYLTRKFGKPIAIALSISIGIIVGVIIYSHEEGCVVESEEQAAKICWFK